MTMHFVELAGRAKADGSVSAEELLELRKGAWANGAICEAEAEALFTLNEALDTASPEWTDFFVATLSEYIVMQSEPRGFVSQANADWLMSALDRDGTLDSMAECELLIRVFERATNVPESLKQYAEMRVEDAVLHGTGPTRCGGSLESGNVNETEARLLRRAIFAPASERPAAVGRREAEMLFRLKDATLGADNHPEWKRLFVQGVGNYLMGHAHGNAQIGRDRAAELQQFMRTTDSSVGGFLGRMAKSAPGALGQIGAMLRDSGPQADYFGDAEQAAKLDADEQQWLDDMMAANRTAEPDPYETALLAFIEAELAER